MIISIQYLRGLAALLVVLTHISFKDHQYSLGVFDFNIGIFGVDIFFVISGFIMYFVSINKPSGFHTVRSFLLHRVIRIIPLYWTLTTVALLVYLAMPENINSSTGSTDVFNSYTLFPSSTRYLLAVAWTLSYEFYFYIIFSIALLFPSYRALIICIVLTGVASLGFIYKTNESSVTFDFLTNNLVLEFIYGIIIAKIFLQLKNRRMLIFIISFLLFIALITLYFLDYQSGIRGIDFGLPAMFLVLGFVMIEDVIKKHRFTNLERLGEISYSLYLVHLFTLGVIALIYRKLNIHTNTSEALYLASMLITSLLVGTLTYYLLEKKLVNFFRRKTFD